MKPLKIEKMMNIIEYEKVRNEYRKDIITYKKNRRIALGPYVSMTFENEKTLTFQIQEIMRAERLVHDSQIQEEADVYNSIMPPEKGLSATLFIEVTDEAKIRPVLNKFIGLTGGESLYFVVNGEKVYGLFEEGREEEDKISSVHYVRFNFSKDQISNFSNTDTQIQLVIDYNDYNFSENLSKDAQLSLSNDFK